MPETGTYPQQQEHPHPQKGAFQSKYPATGNYYSSDNPKTVQRLKQHIRRRDESQTPDPKEIATTLTQLNTHTGYQLILELTLSLLMSYIYGAPCKARNFNVVYIYIYIYMDLRLATLKVVSFYLLHDVSTLKNAESFLVSQLCVNTLPATKITLITNGI
jgi:hypothetical protein